MIGVTRRRESGVSMPKFAENRVPTTLCFAGQDVSIPNGVKSTVRTEEPLTLAG